jgi:hypothetical protein
LEIWADVFPSTVASKSSRAGVIGGRDWIIASGLPTMVPPSNSCIVTRTALPTPVW